MVNTSTSGQNMLKLCKTTGSMLDKVTDFSRGTNCNSIPEQLSMLPQPRILLLRQSTLPKLRVCKLGKEWRCFNRCFTTCGATQMSPTSIVVTIGLAITRTHLKNASSLNQVNCLGSPSVYSSHCQSNPQSFPRHCGAV